MNETLLLALVLVTLVATAVAGRLASGQRHARALSRVEAKVDALLKHEGIEFDPYKDIHPRVLGALRAGNRIEAIKEYRQATGAGLKEAKEYVEEIERRATPHV